MNEQTTPIRLNDDNTRILLYFVIGLTIYIVFNKSIKNFLSNNQFGQAGSDPATNSAISIKQGLNPSGVSWLENFDSTDEELLFQAADGIKDLDAVAKAYSNLYGTNLVDDLTREMNNADFNSWIARAKATNKPTTGTTTGTGINPATGTVTNLFAIRNTNVLDYTNSARVLKSVGAGDFIGSQIGTVNIKSSDGITRPYYVVRWTTLLGYVEYKGFVLKADAKGQ